MIESRYLEFRTRFPDFNLSLSQFEEVENWFWSDVREMHHKNFDNARDEYISTGSSDALNAMLGEVCLS